MRSLITALTLVLFFTVQLPWLPARAQIAEDTHRQDLTFRNMIPNPGFENGKAGWTVTGGDTFSVTSSSTSTKELGKSYATWDSAGAGRVFAHVTTIITSDDSNAGKNSICSANIAVPSGTATHILRVLDGSSNILTSTTITSSTLPTESYVTFIMPASGTQVQCQVISVAANEPSINMYSFWMGQNYLITNVSQATLVASGYIAGTANCGDGWTRTSATLGAVATDASCPGPTVETNVGPGTLQTTDTDLPKFTVNSLPSGIYKVTITGTQYSSIATGNRVSAAVNDGTTTSGETSYMTDGQASSGREIVIVGVFNYTTTANRTFEVYTSSTTGATQFYHETAAAPMRFTIERFPSTPEQAFRPDQGPSSWSGYHKSASCTLTRTNAAYGDPAGDADCDLVERTNRNFGTVSSTGGATETAGITFTPTRTGQYRVCAIVSVALSTTGNDVGLKLWDGTTTIAEGGYTSPGNGYGTIVPLCGKININSIASTSFSIQAKSSAGALTIPGSSQQIGAIEWTVEATDFSMNTPVLTSSYAYTGSVTSTLCAGWTVTNTAYTAFAGDADCDLTQISNENFGTVISAGGATETPGITFNPPVIGKYWICASTGLLTGGAAGTAIALQLYDGTNQLAELNADEPVTSYVVPMTLCGIYNATSTSSATISLRGKSSTNTCNLRADNAANILYWSIFKL